MKVNELIERLKDQPADQDVAVVVDGHAANLVPVVGVGNWSANNGEPTRVVVYADTPLAPRGHPLPT